MRGGVNIQKNNKIAFLCIKIVVYVLLVCLSTTSVVAHSGGTDSNGGHHVTATGEYHYHHGKPAHQHPNGVCPYDSKSSTISSNTVQSTKTAVVSVNNSSSKAETRYLVPGAIAVFCVGWLIGKQNTKK